MKPDPIRGPTVRTYRLVWNKIFFNLSFANDFRVSHFLRVSINIETLDLGKSLCLFIFREYAFLLGEKDPCADSHFFLREPFKNYLADFFR